MLPWCDIQKDYKSTAGTILDIKFNHHIQTYCCIKNSLGKGCFISPSIPQVLYWYTIKCQRCNCFNHDRNHLSYSKCLLFAEIISLYDFRYGDKCNKFHFCACEWTYFNLLIELGDRPCLKNFWYHYKLFKPVAHKQLNLHPLVLWTVERFNT